MSAAGASASVSEDSAFQAPALASYLPLLPPLPPRSSMGEESSVSRDSAAEATTGLPLLPATVTSLTPGSGPLFSGLVRPTPGYVSALDPVYGQLAAAQAASTLHGLHPRYSLHPYLNAAAFPTLSSPNKVR